MRMLHISAEAIERAKEVMKYAEENPYIIGKDQQPLDNQVPGDNPERVMFVPDGYRCCFTFTTRWDAKVFRHLTISVHPAVKGMYPQPISVWVIASDLFGFTGYDTKAPFLSELPPPDWQFAVIKHENCIAVVQEKHESAPVS
jgi:hypothetical protein